MKTLKTLILNDNPIGQLGAALISKLTNLRELNLTNTCMNDKGVEYISKMASLRDLQIGTNHMITKLGALYLSQMKNLQRLSVPATSINDQGVEFLVNLDSLQYLDARGLPLSIRGLETLLEYKTKHNTIQVEHIPIPPTIQFIPCCPITFFQYRFDEYNNYFDQ
ncbi:predicted protein [Naegleria gruberi]|uniref:Predicted protein n=1 Tax=Naegleria gruberi TaxID=5762 RepID=D2W6J5_NAEGR|nr:uncharacterized protein NAEGRDRAFT_77039 [Naegleria gruberi]EFC35307.1 predicted protein [Naegleria gruberi]|eukprot:XP_002668051.1 predicted protein [Naegleria gruberi strain NEG-M]